MFDLNFAIRIVGIGAGAAFLILVGDFLGSKVGRWKLAAVAGIVNLVFMLVFAIYFGVVKG